MIFMKKYSELRSGERLDLRLTCPLPCPLTIHIETTNVCNFRCVQCPTGQADYASVAGYYQHMPMDLYEKVVSDMREFNAVKSLKMYLLGEPLLNKNLGRMISLARSAGVADHIEVTSNGSLLTEQRARELLGSGLEYFRVSVYSISAERQRDITRANATPEEVLSNVRRLRQLRDEAGAETPFICAEMFFDSPDANRRFLEMYRDVADEASVTYPHNWTGSRDFITSIAAGHEISEDACFPTKKKACAFPFYTLAVRSDGNVVVCCVDWTGGTTVGNVRRTSLRGIWEGEPLLRLQQLHLDGKRSENSSCRDCTALYRSPDSLDGLSGQELQKRWDAVQQLASCPTKPQLS